MVGKQDCILRPPVDGSAMITQDKILLSYPPDGYSNP